MSNKTGLNRGVDAKKKIVPRLFLGSFKLSWEAGCVGLVFSA